jgi:hypothetical protein
MKVTEKIVLMTVSSTGHPKHLLMNAHIKLSTVKKPMQNVYKINMEPIKTSRHPEFMNFYKNIKKK